MTGGPPRISPLFDDLDPSQSGGSVRFFADASHVVFSWVSVPEYRRPALPQTFQVRLYVDGSIQFSYSRCRSVQRRGGDCAGICPGRVRRLVSFHNDASAEYSAAVVERFGDTQEIDIVAAAQKFYETHEDAYDYLVIYNNMGIAARRGRPRLRGHGAFQRHGLRRPDRRTTARSTGRRRACEA